MKRSLQEVVELVVFGLVALLIGTGLLWVVGWVLSLGGLLLKAVAGLLWLLLRFVVPVALVAGLVYFLVKALRDRPVNRQDAAAPAAPAQSGGAGGPAAAPAAMEAAATTDAEPAAPPVGDHEPPSAGTGADAGPASAEAPDTPEGEGGSD